VSVGRCEIVPRPTFGIGIGIGIGGSGGGGGGGDIAEAVAPTVAAPGGFFLG
jgi:hypothetical protein